MSVGAEVSGGVVAGPLVLGAEVVAGLVTKQDLKDALQGFNRLKGPVHFQRLVAGAKPPASNKPLVLDLGSPPRGSFWLPQYVIVTGVDPTAPGAIANTGAAVLAGSVPPQSALAGAASTPVSLDMGGVILSSLTVPSTNTVPDKDPVMPNESLYVVFTGTGLVAGSATYYAMVGVVIVPWDPILGGVGLLF